MAEGFARTYGKDVLEPMSAGLYPASYIALLTIQTMKEKNIDLAGHSPKSIEDVEGPFDIVVNMSGERLPFSLGPVTYEWQVRDPIGESEGVFQAVAAQIEDLVMRLILELRGAGRQAVAR